MNPTILSGDVASANRVVCASPRLWCRHAPSRTHPATSRSQSLEPASKVRAHPLWSAASIDRDTKPLGRGCNGYREVAEVWLELLLRFSAANRCTASALSRALAGSPSRSANSAQVATLRGRQPRRGHTLIRHGPSIGVRGDQLMRGLQQSRDKARSLPRRRRWAILQ